MYLKKQPIFIFSYPATQGCLYSF